MSDLILTVPCNFGVEAIVNREIKNLGYEIAKTIDGRVDFYGDELAIARSNIGLRTAERILLKIGEFEAVTFDELFEQTKILAWDDFIPVDAEFPVAKATSLKSTLFSTSDIQAIVKKAVVEKLKVKYKISWFNETGARYPIYVFAHKDIFNLYIDTSGNNLHKRGYRQNSNLAPIKETLAATMLDLTPWHWDRILIDPMCGSGTISIEAALKGLNIAPGINRNFGAEQWQFISKDTWDNAREEFRSLEKRDRQFLVQGYDIDFRALRTARENARLAGVDKNIHFQQRDVKELQSSDKYGFIVTNPPYGVRLEDKKSVEVLYKEMGAAMRRLDTWSYSIITNHSDFELIFGRKADKRRKLYNGMMETTLFQYFGPKPPKKVQEESSK